MPIIEIGLTWLSKYSPDKRSLWWDFVYPISEIQIFEIEIRLKFEWNNF